MGEDINDKQAAHDWQSKKTQYRNLDGLAVKELEKAVGPSEGGHGLDGPWKAFRIRGPMEFHLVGVLLEFSRCLAQRAISIFAISTWDTDYICVKEDNFANACQALKDDGWNVLDKTD
uniref:CASTOR ACT domain-containing protein n=1 Tax=Kalmanozyma brasiliensis (strain GHG001) TaxID=1365824 RepID=V5EH96_KALBG